LIDSLQIVWISGFLFLD